MDLEAVPGVGEKTAAALAELADPDGALREGDVATLSRAPGISEGRAARITRAAIRHEHGEDGDFLATSRAREVYRDALSLLQDRTVTDYAARQLETLYPSTADSRIEEVRTFATGVWRPPTPKRAPAPGSRSPKSASNSSTTPRGWPNSPGGTRP